jgi:hypothetical protein
MRALFIPADESREAWLVNYNPDNDEWITLFTDLIHGKGVDEALDFINFVQEGFQIAVDDFFKVRQPPVPVNARASLLTLRMTGHLTTVGGNVIVLGVDRQGEMLDVPVRVIASVLGEHKVPPEPETDLE